MADNWKITAAASRQAVLAALEAHTAGEWAEVQPVVAGREVAEDAPEWVLEAWLDHQPTEADLHSFAMLFGNDPPPFEVERLAEQDWIALSQQGLEPIRAGRFHVRTAEHPASTDTKVIDLVIPAAQAFGTGQHATTAGCLAMLDRMEREGRAPRNIIDVGTGTGLLAFAALRLWPKARVAASDIDPVCDSVLLENAGLNGVPLGQGAGEVAVAIAPGLDHLLLQGRTPYDLLIANILAQPLIELAPAFAEAIAGGGDVLLAGLLEAQEEAVTAAYEAVRFSLQHRYLQDGWSILWLRKRA